MNCRWSLRCTLSVVAITLPLVAPSLASAQSAIPSASGWQPVSLEAEENVARLPVVSSPARYFSLAAAQSTLPQGLYAGAELLVVRPRYSESATFARLNGISG